MKSIITADSRLHGGTINGTRFGSLTYETEDIIFMASGLIGFTYLQNFVVLSKDVSSPFRWLQSLEEPAFALLVAFPERYCKSYQPRVKAEDQAEIGLGDAQACMIFVTASIPPGRPQDLTLNLRAPILINPESRQAIQCVLDDETYTTKYRVFDLENREGMTAA